jgi:hypothetical protein
MYLLKLFILVILMTVFIQDLRFRAVYWFLFPVLLLSFVVLNMSAGGQGLQLIAKTSLINIGFLSVQLIGLNIYFSFKMGGWRNVAGGLLGWGDILLLYTVAFALPVISFIFFYVASLIFALVCWAVYNMFCSDEKKSKNIPLAGLQAFFLAVVLSINWWLLPMNILNDDWLIYYIRQ